VQHGARRLRRRPYVRRPRESGTLMRGVVRGRRSCGASLMRAWHRWHSARLPAHACEIACARLMARPARLHERTPSSDSRQRHQTEVIIPKIMI